MRSRLPFLRQSRRQHRVYSRAQRNRIAVLDGWQSSLSHPVANRVSPARLRGFESRPIRQLNQGTRTGAFFISKTAPHGASRRAAQRKGGGQNANARPGTSSRRGSRRTCTGSGSRSRSGGREGLQGALRGGPCPVAV